MAKKRFGRPIALPVPRLRKMSRRPDPRPTDLSLPRLSSARCPGRFRSLGQQRRQGFQRVRILRHLVLASAASAETAPRSRSCGGCCARFPRIPVRIPGSVPGCAPDRTFRSWSCARWRRPADLGVGQAGIGLGERHQPALRRARRRIPDREGVVGIETGASAHARAAHRSTPHPTENGSTFHFHQTPLSLVRPTP